ncbi:ATP-binding protein [Sporosarcina trichiuri]|uniref:ATP-binding protein n=1 Tax=Sporosarcina trichiuri TaxID=3056445 RepID=UPI003D673A80
MENQRIRQLVTYPAPFLLLVATSLCPCGYFGSPEHYCAYTSHQIRDYPADSIRPAARPSRFCIDAEGCRATERHSSS